MLESIRLPDFSVYSIDFVADSSPGPVVELDPRPTPIEIFPCAVQVNFALEGIPGSSELQPEEVGSGSWYRYKKASRAK